MSRAGRPRRTWPQRLLLAFNCCFVLVLIATAAGLAYVYSKYARLPRVEVSAVLTERESGVEAQNFLLVGVDTAEGLDPDDPIRVQREAAGIGGLRSDTMMILRVEPGEEKASLLSVPRDLWVPLAGGGSGRINQAIQSGGPSELIETIEGYLSIPIHHYIQVDFAGFQDLVEAIGGVPVYFPDPVRDRGSGLSVPEPGCITLDGAESLAFVRARAYQVFSDGVWRTDPSGDLGRISRQQDFIRRALRRAVDRGARNPITLDELIDVGLDSVVVDDLLTADDILDLAARFRTFNPETLDLYSLPAVGDTIGSALVVRMSDAEAQPLLDLFRGLDPLEVAPEGVRVLVLNGSGRQGEAGMAAEGLEGAGFGVAGTGEAESFDHERTEVRYAAGRHAAADLVARWLDAGAVLVEAPPEDLAADVVLVTGADFTGVQDEPAPPATTDDGLPEGVFPPGLLPTTSTTIGLVPEEPPHANC